MSLCLGLCFHSVCELPTVSLLLFALKLLCAQVADAPCLPEVLGSHCDLGLLLELLTVGCAGSSAPHRGWLLLYKVWKAPVAWGCAKSGG